MSLLSVVERSVFGKLRPVRVTPNESSIYLVVQVGGETAKIARRYPNTELSRAIRKGMATVKANHKCKCAVFNEKRVKLASIRLIKLGRFMEVVEDVGGIKERHVYKVKEVNIAPDYMVDTPLVA